MIYPVRDFSKWCDAQPFGTKTDYGYHEAADLNLLTGGDTDLGQDLLAIAKGQITSVHIHTTSGNFGKHVHLKCEGTWGVVWVHYAHCSEILVKEGDFVEEGQVIAKLGKSGTGYSHCHFAIKLEPTGIEGIARTEEELKKWTNPIEFIDKWSKIEEELIASDIIDDKTKYNFGDPLGELEIGAVRSSLLDGRKSAENYENLLKIHASVKEDFRIELQEAETKYKLLKEFVADVAKKIGTNQETEPIKARIDTLVANETKLSNIQDVRPLSPHPFEGVGELTRKLLELLFNSFKKWLKK